MKKFFFSLSILSMSFTAFGGLSSIDLSQQRPSSQCRVTNGREFSNINGYEVTITRGAAKDYTISIGKCGSREKKLYSHLPNVLDVGFPEEGILMIKVLHEGKVQIKGIDLQAGKAIEGYYIDSNISQSEKWAGWTEDNRQAAEDLCRRKSDEGTADDKRSDDTHEETTDDDSDLNTPHYFSMYKPWLFIGGVGIVAGVIWYTYFYKKNNEDEQSVQRNFDGSLPEPTA